MNHQGKKATEVLSNPKRRSKHNLYVRFIRRNPPIPPMNNEFSDQATPDKMKELMNGFSQTDY
jgi:hypothetical protein